MDVGVWLRRLGLGRYEKAFRKNDINFTVLSELTDQDLKGLGISLGHRRELLKAIRSLVQSEVDRGQTKTERPEPPLSRPATQTEGERRQLTILFCDLVDSTALSVRLDLEDMREVLRAYQNACASIIVRFGGFPARYLGDGVLAYFGYPEAHEDDAERGVRAGLELVEAVPRLTTPAPMPLAARVGIATGKVVVGDLVGDELMEEEAVVGETPNLAARLQVVAQPGAVVIASTTRQLIGGLFELIDLGAQQLKGFAEPIYAWQVSGECRVEGRFEAQHGAELTPLIGRDEEYCLLQSRWHEALKVKGQVVLLSGEAGIGKSRIVESLRVQLADEGHLSFRYFCSPFHVNTALHPVLEQLEKAAGIGRDDSVKVQLDLLQGVISRGTVQVGEATYLLAQALGIPTGQRYPAPKMTPQRQKQRTIEILVEQLEGLAARNPILVIFEDAHWIDPSTQDFLALLVERIVRLPVLLLLTFRQEYQPAWIGHSHVTQLMLNRLNPTRAATMVKRISSGKQMPAEVLDQILAKTDGVPLFVEELTKAILDSDLLMEADTHFELAGPLLPFAIPATLQDSLMARIDRLGSAKQVAQIGAVIGREFSKKLLTEVALISEDQLQDALNQLVASKLIVCVDDTPNAAYSFKHALVQETAYQSLLKSRLKELHARVALVMEGAIPDMPQTAPELIAQHFTQADLAEKAILYWIVAGQRAAEHSANAEAVAHLRTGLDVLERLPDGDDRVRLEIKLLTLLGQALIASKGHGFKEVGMVYRRARARCRVLRDDTHLAAILGGLRVHYLIRGDLRLSLEVGTELLNFAEHAADVDYLLEAHRALGVIRFALGDFVTARAHLEEGIALYEPEKHASHVYQYDNDPGVVCFANLARALWHLGYPDQAVKRAERALALARASSHLGSIVEAMTWWVELALLRREIMLVLERGEAALALSANQGFPSWASMTMVMHGWALSEGGQSERGLAQIRDGMRMLAPSDDRIFTPYALALLAQALSKNGQLHEGLTALDEAIDSSRDFPSAYWSAELFRLKGELLFQQGASKVAGVEVCFRKSLTIAQDQNAKSLELRAAIGLARLWCDQGKHAEAHDLLAPIYDWFTEGLDTIDLKNAKLLLDELR